MGTEESIILGIDITDSRATIGLVLSVWQDMSVSLCGDGGFELITRDRGILFKPISVQALWAAFQAVDRACSVARINAYYCRSFNHDWVAYYHGLPTSVNYQIQEWLKFDDIDSFNRCLPLSCLSVNASEEERETVRIKELVRIKLKEIMYTVDLEEVTVLQLRNRLEDDIGQSLHAYRHFIEAEVIRIYGQMDESSEIFPHLLLGTTFNASNGQELKCRSVTHILNVTREVDNFFPGESYLYKNIRVYDEEKSSLLPYFEDTHRFINEAKSQGTCCLVHCKMGISRSATVVIAYTMKEKNMDLNTALNFVRSRRQCIQPNPGFMRELQTYQGILEASSNRYKAIFCQVPDRRSAPAVLPGSTTTPVTCASEFSLCSHGLLRCDSACREDVASPTGNDSITSNACVPKSEEVPTTPSVSTAGVNLESELFAYKQMRHLSDDVQQQLVDVGNAVDGKTTEKMLINYPKVYFDTSKSLFPISHEVLDLGSAEDEEKLKGVTMVAHNSHCLRQWHPDVVENVGSLDVRPATLSTGLLPRSRSMRQPQHPRLHSSLSNRLADKPCDIMSMSADQQHDKLDSACPPHDHSPDTSRDCEQGRLDCSVTLKGIPQEDTQGAESDYIHSHSQGPPQSSSYVLRMVSKLAESSSAQPSLHPSTSGPRKRNLNLGGDRKAISTSSSQYSDIVLSPNTEPMISSFVDTSLGLQPGNHPISDDLSPHRSVSLCRSAPESQSQPRFKSIIRSQSDRQTMAGRRQFTFPSRLRPDHSWIVREPKASEISSEAACSQPRRGVRPQSSLSTTACSAQHSDKNIDFKDRDKYLPHTLHPLLAFVQNQTIQRPANDSNIYCHSRANTSDPVRLANISPTTAYSVNTSGFEFVPALSIGASHD